MFRRVQGLRTAGKSRDLLRFEVAEIDETDKPQPKSSFLTGCWITPMWHSRRTKTVDRTESLFRTLGSHMNFNTDFNGRRRNRV
jgi:hypothetical protein